MDSCIFYLIIRMACVGGLAVLVRGVGVPFASAAPLAAGACALLYAALILLLARKQHADSREKLLDGGCPFAGRRRLQGRSPLGPVVVAEACAFGAMPLAFMLLPGIVQAKAVRTVGSVIAHTLMLETLAVGWGYRMVERFVLDGCAPMRLIVALQARKGTRASWVKSGALTALAALFSPTAVLHGWTGVTLVAGYMHARSVDQQVVALWG